MCTCTPAPCSLSRTRPLLTHPTHNAQPTGYSPFVDTTHQHNTTPTPTNQSQQVAYLQQDCDAALVKIRVALRPSDKVDLPPGSQAAPLETITFGLDPAAAAAVAARARKARGGKNNNNAGGDGGDGDAAAGGAGVGGAGSGSAAAVDGWLGPVDEDGLMLGLDEDITWDDEVLMLGGEVGTEAGGFGAGFGAGFPRFEPNSRLSFGLAPSHSGLGSQVRPERVRGVEREKREGKRERLGSGAACVCSECSVRSWPGLVLLQCVYAYGLRLVVFL